MLLRSALAHASPFAPQMWIHTHSDNASSHPPFFGKHHLTLCLLSGIFPTLNYSNSGIHRARIDFLPYRVSQNFSRCDRICQCIQHNSINPSIEFANVSTLIGLLIRTQPLIQTETWTWRQLFINPLLTLNTEYLQLHATRLPGQRLAGAEKSTAAGPWIADFTIIASIICLMCIKTSIHWNHTRGARVKLSCWDH